jgi:hypothetical protein
LRVKSRRGRRESKNTSKVSDYQNEDPSSAFEKQETILENEQEKDEFHEKGNKEMVKSPSVKKSKILASSLKASGEIFKNVIMPM